MSTTYRKIFVSAALAALTLGAGAQNMYDAINFSRNEYVGSARSMALGNAVTAVGGDLGTIGINPAGSAVAPYGQLTITPGLSISAVSSSFSPAGESAYGSANGVTRTKTAMPNFGVSMLFDTGRSRGLKSFTFAVVSNQTAQYNYGANAYGTNSQTSKMAEFAAAAAGIDESILQDYKSFDKSGVSWDVLTAYQGGMFGSFGSGLEYVGSSEVLDGDGTYHYVPGPLSQNSFANKAGSKNDLIINLGMNISDKVFLGVNLGMPLIRYRYSETFHEAAVNPEQFPVTFVGENETYDTYFKGGTFAYDYASRVDGVYAKFGVIVLPFEGLRIGAAIQTPTAYTVAESWQYAASTSFDDGYFNDSETSPEGSYTYMLRSPYLFNVGAAYTFGQFGLLSVDYEMTDYSVMRFTEVDPDRMSEDIFLDLNEANKHFAGLSHTVRIGGEIKILPELALRAGYSVTTTPERHWRNNHGDDVTADDFLYDFDSYFTKAKTLVSSSYYGDRTRSVSFGIGYSSRGSFFADLGAMFTKYPDSLFSPYYDYDNYNAAGQQVNVASPKILNNRGLWNVALTLGWRF